MVRALGRTVRSLLVLRLALVAMTLPVKFALRLLTPEEAARLEPLPIFCTTCSDTGTIPADPIFVNTAHNYGIEYRSEEPCPNCGGADDE